MNVALLIALLAALGILLIAIVRFKVHPFLALMIVSLGFGMAAGLSAEEAVERFLVGFGNTLKWIGVVIVLGTIIGELLNDAGATLRIANTILKAVGRKRLPLAMGLTGYVVSIPAFVDVAYIMLRPIVEALAAKSRRNVLVVGLSLSAGLTASHALLPPTPGPLATVGLLKANLGPVILMNGFVAVCAVLGGLLWAVFYCPRARLAYDDKLQEAYANPAPEAHPQSAGGWSAVMPFVPIVLPLMLIAAGAFVGKQEQFGLASCLRFLGTPIVALLVGMGVALALLKRGTRLTKLNLLLDRSIERSAVVIMITGAGGGFGAVIQASQVGDQIAAAFAATSLPGLLFPFLLAAALTTATGSLTVSMVTSASVVGPMVAGLGLSPELAVTLIGAGSLCVIHANSSFFWLLSRLHEAPPHVLYATYSMQSLCMGAGGLLGVCLLKLFGVS